MQRAATTLMSSSRRCRWTLPVTTDGSKTPRPRAKQICASCPVFGDCAAMALLNVADVPPSTQGVWAAMTSSEREWIRNNPAAARDLSRQLAAAGVDPIVLSMLRISPDSSELGSTPAETA